MDTTILLNSGLISFATALAATSGGEIIKPVTQILDNWFYTKFGSKTDFERKKTELKIEHELNLYKSELENKSDLSLYELEVEKERLIGVFKKEIVEYLLEISPDNVQIPDQQIVALVMENIHLYLSVDELRNKFAKLLASSSDKSHSDKVHPLFIETIKNLSSADANFLDSLGNMSFAVLDNISIKSIPKKDEIPHGFFVDHEKYQMTTSFILKLDKEAIGIPVLMEDDKYEDRGFYIENEELLPIYFLEKQNILTRKKVEEAALFPAILLDRYVDLTKKLVEEHPNLLDYQNYIETIFKQETRVEHQFSIVELSPYGQNFKKLF